MVRINKPERLLVLGVFLIVLFLSIEPIKNYDIWWHLKTGELIVETGKIPKSDIFSYTSFGASWINHEWLAQVLLYMAYKVQGAYGLVLLRTILLTFTFFLIYRRNKLFLTSYSNALALSLTAMISHISWLNRPLLFGFLLLSATIYLMDLKRFTGNDRSWILIPVFLLWANLHGSFIIGLLTVAIYTFTDKRFFSRNILVLILGTGATLINPYTYRTLLYPLQYTGVSVHTRFIEEWQSPSFHTITAFEIAILLSLLALAIAPKVDLTDLIMILVFSHLGLFAQRNTALYAILVVPLIFRYLEKGIQLNLPTSFLRSFSISFLILGALLFGWSLSNRLDTLPLEEQNYPVRASQYLQNHPELSQHKMVNTYEWGGYLIWNLHPTYKVYIDGRADLHGSLLEEYQAIMAAGPFTQELLLRRDISLVIIKKGSALDNLLRTEPGWQETYSDDLTIVHIKNS